MHSRKSSPPPLAAFIAKSLAGCIAAGVLIGHVVMALAGRHQGSPFGLVCALVFLLAGSAAVLLLCQHLHLRRGSAAAGWQPLRTWLLALGAGVLAALPGEALPGLL